MRDAQHAIGIGIDAPLRVGPRRTLCMLICRACCCAIEVHFAYRRGDSIPIVVPVSTF